MGKILDQEITDNYAIYNGDCLDVMPAFPDESIHLSVYSPPFTGLYQYSSSERDLSNARDYDEFFAHYELVVREIHRLTMPGRVTAVHCMDVPTGNTGRDSLIDFPGDIIRLHTRLGFDYIERFCIWKDALKVRNRTMIKALAHKVIVDDSSLCSNAGADYVLTFRKRGKNLVPIIHPVGLTEYAGARTPPTHLLRYRGWTGNQIENRFSHWIWQQYAAAIWDDIRVDHVLPFKPSRDPDDEKHVHPLQLDVIDRILVLRSNPGERVLTPFMGVGSEVYGAVRQDRFGIGVDLKPSYYAQARKNIARAKDAAVEPQEDLLSFLDAEDADVDADPAMR
jgi:hypothetical protein